MSVHSGKCIREVPMAEASGAQSLESLLSSADLRSVYSSLFPPLILVKTQRVGETNLEAFQQKSS